MALYAKLWTEILDDPKLMRAADDGRRNLVLLPWLIAFAKRAEDSGRLSVGNLVARPSDIARGIPSATPKQVAVAIADLTGIGVLVEDEDGCPRFAQWERRSGEREGRGPAQPDASEGFVYYARSEHEVKIGFSKNPWARLAEMRTARPSVILVAIEPGTRETERERHEQFGRVDFSNTKRGSEWFAWSDEISAHCDQLRRSYVTENRRQGTTDNTTENRSIVRARSIEQEQEQEQELDTARDVTSRPARPNPDVDAVIARYLRNHPKRRPSDKDRSAIRRALKAGYTAADLCAAIDGNAVDPWHRQNAKHELTYTLRDNGKIDQFRDIAARPMVDDFGVLTEWGKQVSGGAL